MQTFLTKTKFPTLALIALLLNTSIQAQKLDRVLDQFESYAELPREIAFLHLNKSVYLKGEPLGYKGYILDKKNLQPSLETSNLYLTIANANGTIIKSDLLWVKEGTTSGTIQIDSLFDPGEYTIKAYSNWMFNFQETNHFEQSILVVNPQDSIENTASGLFSSSSEILADFLPEGGYAPVNVETAFGAVFKDNEGYGVAGVEGKVVNQQNKELTLFKTNSVGLGRFSLVPKQGEKYSVVFEHNGKQVRKKLEHIRPMGVGIKLQTLKDKVVVKLSSSHSIQEKYILIIHNGSDITGTSTEFNNQKEKLIAFEKKDLFEGINIITVFNSQGKPILERLFFNEYNWKSRTPEFSITEVTTRDSIDVTLKLAGLDSISKNSLSASILPSYTISANSHHTLTSFANLAPHLKTPIENAHYYFNNPSTKKWFELDLVLMTQGWSAYNWNTVFNKKPEYRFDFEKGISAIVSDNNDTGREYFVYPMTNHNSQLTKANEGTNQFTINQLYPFEDEKISFSQLEKKGGLSKPGIYVQFKPSRIPEVALLELPHLSDRWKREAQFSDLPPYDLSIFNKVEELEEVVVTKTIAQQRRESISNKSFGSVDFFELNDPKRNQFLGNYLSGRGFKVYEQNGLFRVINRNPIFPGNPTPAIFLDDALLADYDILYRFRLSYVDYIEINRAGIGGGLRFGGGIIRIVTDPTLRLNWQKSGESVKTYYTIPLTFSAPNEYYAPQFDSVSSPTFLKYGTLYWNPELKFNAAGEAVIRIPKSADSEVIVDVQGIYNNKPYSHKARLSY